MHAFLHLLANTVHLTYLMPIVVANCDDCIVAVGYESIFFVLHVSAFATYSKKCKGKGHPCTGTEALYRPYGPWGE